MLNFFEIVVNCVVAVFLIVFLEIFGPNMAHRQLNVILFTFNVSSCLCWSVMAVGLNCVHIEQEQNKTIPFAWSTTPWTSKFLLTNLLTRQEYYSVMVIVCILFLSWMFFQSVKLTIEYNEQKKI